MSKTYLDVENEQLNQWEGDVLHAYLDTDRPPNVTVGKGYLIATLADMLKLPWRHARTQSAATQAEIVQEWDRVRAMPPGLIAPAYASPYGLELSPADVDALTAGMLQRCDADLRAMYPGYDQFPDCVKVALLDMIWNLGKTKLEHEYPHFNFAVNMAQWDIAARYCSRNMYSPAFAKRNRWTQGLFTAAHQQNPENAPGNQAAPAAQA